MSGSKHLNSNDQRSLDALLIEWESGTIDEAGAIELQSRLKSDSQARSDFVTYQMFAAALHLDSAAGIASEKYLPENAVSRPSRGDSEVPSVVVRPRNTLPLAVGWLAAFAVAVAFVLGGRLAMLEFGTSTENKRIADSSESSRPRLEPSAIESFPSRDASEATSSGVALVTRLVGVDWINPDHRIEVGQALDPGRFVIDSGLAQVEFFCGATVIIEGPAELDLKSSMLAFVHRGRLRASVPPAARGFTIDVADMKVVDLGTEFGLSVSPEGTDVEVFDGEVEVHPSGGAMKRVIAGEAISHDRKGDLAVTETDQQDYIDIASLDSREQFRETQRQSDWRSWSNAIRSVPNLVAYYRFDAPESGGRKLINGAIGQSELPASEYDGAIVGAQRNVGRWPGKGALEFKHPGDRVRVLIPGDFDSLTLACWVKIDSLDRRFNSLFLTDNYDQGEPHWQILETGQLYFSVRPSKPGDDGPTDQKILSPRFWKPSMSGKWIHLATSFDATTGQTIHYFNGQPIHKETIHVDRLPSVTRIGSASIGNWSMPTQADASFAIRNLNGSMDEFALFSGVLTASEIADFYRNGKP